MPFMHTTVTIDRAGRIIVPKAVRDAFQLEARDTLELESEGERLTLRLVRAGSALRKEQGVWVFRRGGALITAAATDAVLDEVRSAGTRRGGRRA